MREMRNMTRQQSFLAALLAACLAHPARLPAQENPGGDALSGLRSASQQAIEQPDLEASIALFTPDAVFLLPDGNRYDDRAAIRTLYKSVMALYHSHIRLTSKRQDCSGKLCVDEGTYAETLTENTSGKKIEIYGSYVLAARRDPNGAWKIAEFVWTGGPGAPH